jgi:hypothetical protein
MHSWPQLQVQQQTLSSFFPFYFHQYSAVEVGAKFSWICGTNVHSRVSSSQQRAMNTGPTAFRWIAKSVSFPFGLRLLQVINIHFTPRTEVFYRWSHVSA